MLIFVFYMENLYYVNLFYLSILNYLQQRRHVFAGLFVL